MAEDDFKDTEIGRIPKEWEITNLSQVGKVQSGGNAPQGDNYFLDGKYPFIRVQHFDGSKRYVYKFDLINDEAIRDYGLKLYPAGSIIFPKSGASINLEKKAMLFVDSYVVSHLAIVVPKRSVIDEMFLFYYLKTVELKSMGKGSTLPYLNLSIIANIPIPIPPINEQTRIAYVLSTIQNAIEIQDKMIEALQKLKKSMMHKLFTEGIGHTEFKDTEIGRIPKEWGIAKLSDISLKGKNVDPKNFGNQTFFYIDVSSVSRQELSINNVKEIQASFAPSRARKLINSGDIIFATVRPSLKRVAIIPNELDGQICSTAFCVIKTRNDISLSGYLFAYVSDDYFVNEVSKKEKGATYPSITDYEILNRLIPLPSISEQRKISEINGTLNFKIKAEIRQKTSLESLFKTVLNKLMTGHIRVKDLVIPA